MTGLMLALVTDAYGGKGGIAQYNRDILDVLATMTSRFDAIEVLPRLPPTDELLPPETVHQHTPRIGRLAYSFAAVRTTLTKQPSLIFCGHLYMAPLAWLLARLVKARFVIQLHGIEIWTRPTNAQRRALEAADLVLCVSRHTRACARSQAAISSEAALVIANTFADDYRPGNRLAARTAMGFAESDLLLLSVGRLDDKERYKGHDRVISELARLVSHQDRSIRYIIAGDGNDRPRLEALASKLGVRESISFLGQVDRASLPDLYRAADLFVLPSEGEGFGIVFLEAMASGTPALGLAVGGAPDALGDGELGWCVAKEDHANALKKAIVSPQVDSDALAAKVRSRFGREVFHGHVTRAFARL